MGHPPSRLLVALLFFVFSLAFGHADDWNVNGHTYQNVKVIRHDAVNVTILDSDGGATIAISDLSPEWQKKLGYDPAAAQKQKEELAKQAEQIKTNKLIYDNAFHAVGKIIQVLPDGVLAEFTATGNKLHENTTAQTSVNAVHTGTSDLGQGADVTSTSVTYHTQYDHDQIQSDCAFVVCDTKGLVEDQDWKGTIFAIGSYSYTTVSGIDKTVPKYTISADDYLSFVKPSQKNLTPAGTSGQNPVATDK
jgi:hypothetical protein